MSLAYRAIRNMVVFLGVLICQQSTSLADNFEGHLVKRFRLDPALRKVLDRADADRLVIAKQAHATRNGGEEAVIQTRRLWPPGKISICFMDGEIEKWVEVASLAQSWTERTSVWFDFSEGGGPRRCSVSQPTDIRVSFSGGAYSSEVGTGAQFIPVALPTLMLGGLGGKRALTQRERAIVLHEFGHALGFEHELQSPAAVCEAELNWPFLYRQYGARSYVDENMKSFLGTGKMTGIYSSSFDVRSIMMYELPRAAFLQPDSASCYAASRSTSQSPTDIATVREVYRSGN